MVGITYINALLLSKNVYVLLIHTHTTRSRGKELYKWVN